MSERTPISANGSEKRKSPYGRATISPLSGLLVSGGDKHVLIRIEDEDRISVTEVQEKGNLGEPHMIDLPLEDDQDYPFADGKVITFSGGRVTEGQRNINFRAPVDLEFRRIPLLNKRFWPGRRQ